MCGVESMAKFIEGVSHQCNEDLDHSVRGNVRLDYIFDIKCEREFEWKCDRK